MGDFPLSKSFALFLSFSHQSSDANLVRMDFLPRKIPKANDTRIRMGMALDLIERSLLLPER